MRRLRLKQGSLISFQKFGDLDLREEWGFCPMWLGLEFSGFFWLKLALWHIGFVKIDFVPWAKQKVEWTMSPAGCRCICSGQTSPEGFKVFFAALSTTSTLASFTGCNTGNCNIQNISVFLRQRALQKVQSPLKPYCPRACFVGRNLGCNKLLKLCCSDEKAKYSTVTIVECAYSI